MKWCAAIFICWTILGCKTVVQSQSAIKNAGPEKIEIRSAKLYKSGDQTSFPSIALGSTDGLELHFDEMNAGVRSYYYAYQLCNWDWTPSVLHAYEYTKGFQNVRINNYRVSSITGSRYIHYQASVPDRNSFPTKSGNYLLRIFLNNDTAQTVFTKRFVVTDNKTTVAAQLQQPFSGQIFRTHQKLQIAINTDSRLQLFSPQDLKVVILQNNNWQTALAIDRPTISRGNYFEYSDEALTSMPAGKEWRWLDLRSLRLRSDRMQSIDTRSDTTNVVVKTDHTRNGEVYIFYRDQNGSYSIETLESVNPFWQGEYGLVHFSYLPPAGKPFKNQDVYLFGELTNYGDESGKMEFNEAKAVYEKTLLLKQGYYNYVYATRPRNETTPLDFSITEGNHWGTENSYTVLVYFRPFGARADELVGSATLNSAFQRNGF